MRYRHILIALVGLAWLTSVWGTGPDATGILTNASEGSFPADQRFWFSVPPGQRLRLVLDDKELYRGPGPGAALLSAPTGGERAYALVVERRSAPPEDTLEETRTYRVVIDRRAPAAPVFGSHRNEAGEWELTVSAPGGDEIEILAAEGASGPVRRPQSRTFVAGDEDLYLAAWTVDGAGNYSAPVPFVFEPLRLELENPVSGTWANRQRLVVRSRGARELRWTDDGSDPLAEGAQIYSGPVLVDRTGEVVVRVALQAADGRVEERRVSYTVSAGTADPDSLTVIFAEAEAETLRTDTVLTVPPDYLWALGDGRWLNGGVAVTLRPFAFGSRLLPLQLSGARGHQRFVFTLLADQAGAPLPATAGGVPGTVPLDGLAESAADQPQPAILRHGPILLATWPGTDDAIRYRLGADGAWTDLRGPVLISASGGTLQWLTEASAVAGEPFSLTIPPALPGGTETKTGDAVRGHFEYRSRESSWTELDTIVLPTRDDLARLAPDACDGEDMAWRFVDEAGQVLRSWRVDRLAPGEPLLTAPEEDSWVSGTVQIRAQGGAGDADAQALVQAVRAYPSGRSDSLSGSGGLTLDPPAESPVAVVVTAVLVDASGNRGPVLQRTFTVDSDSIYVSSRGKDGADGSRNRPFATLEEALARAETSGRRVIRVGGGVELRSSADIPPGIRIEGHHTETWQASGALSRISAAPGAGLHVRSGEATLVGLTLSAADGALPLISVHPGSRLVMQTCELSAPGPLLLFESAQGEILDSLLDSAGTGEARIVVLRAENTALQLSRTRLQVSGINAVALEQRGGSLALIDSVCQVEGSRTGIGLWLRDLAGSMSGLLATVQGGNYASVVDAAGGRLRWSGGLLAAEGRDVVAAVLAATDGEFIAADFRLASSFVGRAIEGRGLFPVVRDSRFLYRGVAERSEAFTARASAARGADDRYLDPEPASISGNRFAGFTELLDARFTLDQLDRFNRRYAGPGRENRLDPEDAPE